MPDILDAVAAGVPDKPAVVQDDRSWTYAELNARANALASALLGLGLRAGDRAVWVGPNDEKVILWGHTTRKVGLVSVPLNYRFTPDEMTYVIRDSDSVLVYCHPDWEQTIRALDLPAVRHVISHDDAERLIKSHAGQAPEEPPEGLGSSMIYTSGTTGLPKGALRQSSDLNLIAAMIGELGLSSDDVHLTTGPLYHSGPAAFAGLNHLLGATTVVLDKFDPARWLDLVQRHRVSTTFSAPTQLKRLVSLPPELIARHDTSSLRVVIANAAPVPYSLKEQWVKLFGEGNLFEIYGSTELGVDTILRPDDQLRKPGSCGRPYGGIEIRLLREDGTEAQPGEPGEMWIRTTLAFDHYHKAPDKTEQTKLSVDPEWRSVGDIAYRDEEGYFFICDRKSDMVITGGMNVYPAEVEAVLHSHPDVMDAAVYGVPSEEWGEEVRAAVQPKPGAEVAPDELIALCRTKLAGYKVPRKLELRESLPRTESGKLLKRVLREEHRSEDR
ncbi:MAG TPA: AMP-binding protein [Actinomycetota bacterium]|nr:AMP-binding protein [Actinomycetota bacterium]